MKKAIAFLFVSFIVNQSINAQIYKPVTWAYAAKKTGPNTATIFIKGSIQDGWHLYSQFLKEGGPVATTFTFISNKGYTLIGKPTEPKPITKYQEVFKMNVDYFEKSVIFQQKVKLNVKSAVIKGKVEFMVCDDKQCLPPDEVEFSVAVK